jgi:glycosyltransferase involved in cell wall biosynthesis
MRRDTSGVQPRAYGSRASPIARRICYVLNHSFPYCTNGYAVRSHGIASALVEHGFSVVALNRPGSPWDLPGFPPSACPSSYAADGVCYVFTRLTRFDPSLCDRWQDLATRELVDHLETFRPAAVVAASNWENALPALHAARQVGLPYFYEVRGFWELSELTRDDAHLMSSGHRMAMQRELEVALGAQRVFTLNSLMRDELVRRGVPATKIDVVPNAIGHLPRLTRRATDLHVRTRTRFCIGYIGSFSEYEGLDDLLCAVHGLRAAGWDVRLRLVGSSNSAGVTGTAAFCTATEALRQQAARLGIDGHVEFIGRVSPSEVAAQYDGLDLFVLPRKPLPVCELVPPLKPLEAAAHGCPMLASDVAPLEEIAREAGIALFRKGSVRSLQEAIASLLADAGTRMRMSVQAREWVARERLLRTAVAPMVSALQACAAGPTGSTHPRDSSRAAPARGKMADWRQPSHRIEGGQTRAAARALRRLSVGRFQVLPGADGTLECTDALMASPRIIRADVSRGLHGADCIVELLRRGFLSAAMGAACRTIGSRPASSDDAFFWQFPARTEGAAWDAHVVADHTVMDANALHVYLGLPWATWIDMASRRVSAVGGVVEELGMQHVRIEGYRRILGDLGLDLRIHTVCQHVHWRSFLAHWRDLCVTDLWLSHAPASQDGRGSNELRLHPWHLHAVNVETADRTMGLQVGIDPAQKTLLASFVGAHADHYLSDARLRLLALADVPGFHVKLTHRWHFEDLVYQHQVKGAVLREAVNHDDSVRSYNDVLSNSRFSLCPAGAGPNTLRLWESLAVGSVPVLLGPAPRLPEGGTLPPIDWEAIVLRVADDQIPDLPRILGSVPIEEVRRRQQLGLQAYHWVRTQRCF